MNSIVGLYLVRINKYADLTSDEFGLRHLKLGAQLDVNQTFSEIETSTLPKSFTWQGKAVTAVKDEEDDCGACWAFSTTGAVEGCLAIATKQLISLSEQNLIDCSGQNCNGGHMNQAFEYIVSNDGIDSESCYPYSATSNTCQYSKSCCSATITGYQKVQSGSETALQVNF